MDLGSDIEDNPMKVVDGKKRQHTKDGRLNVPVSMQSKDLGSSNNRSTTVSKLTDQEQ